MKLLNVSFLLILAALGLANRVKRNAKLKENKQTGDEQHSSSHRAHPPTQGINPLAPPIKISVTQPISDDEHEWRDEQKQFWERQLNIPKELNQITFFAGLVGLGGLGILYFTVKATEEAAVAAKEHATDARTATE